MSRGWYEDEIRRLAEKAGEPEAAEKIIDAIDDARWDAEREAVANAEQGLGW